MIPNDLRYKKQRYPIVGRTLDIISQSIFFGIHFQTGLFLSLKQNDNLTVYQNEEKRVHRNFENDRHFPLETVMLQSHKLKHDTELNNAMIHIGSTADEFARSFNALALTVGRDIFFRHGAYKPETEEGRKILAHELTHVAQYEEDRITAKKSVKELEQEAEMAERQGEYDDDPLEEIEIGGEIFYLHPSEHPEVIYDAIEMTKRWLEEQKYILDEKEYFRLLQKYAELKKRI